MNKTHTEHRWIGHHTHRSLKWTIFCADCPIQIETNDGHLYAQIYAGLTNPSGMTNREWGEMNIGGMR